MRVTVFLAAAALLAAAPAAAQGDHSAADQHGMATSQGMPDGWLMRFDRSNAGADQARFAVMTPGWHLTTGERGSALFWMPDMTTSGQYRIDATIHLMRPSRHAEAFGVFLGAKRLEGADQAYTYFLVRQNGEFLVKLRRGDDTPTVAAWTAHSAIPEAAADKSTRYDLAVQVGLNSVDLYVNGQQVHSVPRSQVMTEGVVGLRVNHMLDVHVEKLEVSPLKLGREPM